MIHTVQSVKLNVYGDVTKSPYLLQLRPSLSSSSSSSTRCSSAGSSLVRVGVGRVGVATCEPRSQKSNFRLIVPPFR